MIDLRAVIPISMIEPTAQPTRQRLNRHPEKYGWTTKSATDNACESRRGAPPSILGGRGKYFRTIGGALLLTVHINLLTVEDIREAGRMIVQGVLILILLIAYATMEQ